MDELTPEEQKTLREFLQNLMAMGRARRLLTTGLLWLAGIVGAVLVIWDAWVQFIGHSR